MQRIALWFLSTVAVVALLFGYPTSTAGPALAASETVVAAPVAPDADTSSTGTSSTGTTFTGSVAETSRGSVQVQITVADGRITAVEVPVYPDENARHQQISAEALPILVQETLSAQSADVDMVSGATATSEGYVESLQSALDQAGL